MWLYHRVMSQNDGDGMANSVETLISLIWVCTVCPGIAVQKLRIITVNVDLYMNSVDLTKAFDAVRKLLRNLATARVIAMVRHDGWLARVHNIGEYSDPFPVTNGVEQRCMLAPTLISMMFSAMLTDAF